VTFAVCHGRTPAVVLDLAGQFTRPAVAQT
jgi:hypothetical protein